MYNSSIEDSSIVHMDSTCNLNYCFPKME